MYMKRLRILKLYLMILFFFFASKNKGLNIAFNREEKEKRGSQVKHFKHVLKLY